jgi:hypothetical protein
VRNVLPQYPSPITKILVACLTKKILFDVKEAVRVVTVTLEKVELLNIVLTAAANEESIRNGPP